MRPKCLVVSAVAFGLLRLAPSLGPRAERDCRRRPRYEWSRIARRRRRSLQSRPYRKDALRCDRWEGAYRVVDLRPGLYAVTFSLPGFTSLKRDGLLCRPPLRPQ